jgi:pyridoxine 4-dehydrogenase
MAKLDARKSGTFKIGGEIKINRLGFGAMRVTGKGIWGPPEDRPEALRTLKRVPELGINFIDTADSYGPEVSEELIHEALFPYKGMLIATKAGFQRTGPSAWQMDGRPEWLRERALSSCKRLGVKRIDLWQLHRIDPKVSRKAQFAATKSLIIRFAGLSEVSVADIEEASQVFPVVSVQNRYNLVDRGSEDVLEYCEANGIGFIPWYPLAAGELAEDGSILGRIAKKHSAAPDCARLGAETQPGDVADPWHVEGQASRGERRGGEYRSVGGRVRHARLRRPCCVSRRVRQLTSRWERPSCR